jgi:hypothetical protein
MLKSFKVLNSFPKNIQKVFGKILTLILHDIVQNFVPRISKIVSQLLGEKINQPSKEIKCMFE